MKYRLLTLLLCFAPFVNGSCTEKKSPEPAPEPVVPEPVVEPGPELVLVAPSDSASFEFDWNGEYDFEWEAFEGQNFYWLYFSPSPDMEPKASILANSTQYKFSGGELNDVLRSIGVGSLPSGTVYWSVAPWSPEAKYTPQVRTLTINSLPDDGVAESVTEPLKVKVAVVVEDPVFESSSNPNDERNGKRIHEIEGWNDPWAQLEEYAADFEQISHGAVDIEIVEIHDSQKMFCYTTSTQYSTREYMTPELLFERYLDPAPENGKAHIDIDGKTLSYDYVAMMDEFGLSQKVDDGTINEVWVYNHPACKMNESRFMGEGGFWCNSMPIHYGTGANYAHNRKLVCVMFCNYERSVDLALHSFAHRTESIMSQVYYQNYNTQTRRWRDLSKYGVFTYVYNTSWFTGGLKDLSKFDLFFSHGSAFDKIGESGYAHIGICHSPCNTDVDYGYGERTSIKTFADEWDNYPWIHCRKDKAREITCSEWEHPKGYQYGYMLWFFSHIPHFEGINTYDEGDLHLNNWWWYLFDYYGALEKEAALREQINN